MTWFNRLLNRSVTENVFFKDLDLTLSGKFTEEFTKEHLFITP